MNPDIGFTAWFQSGLVIDLILVLVLIEAVLLWLFRRRTGRGPSMAGLLPTLASGALLLLALRMALVEARWIWIAGPLSLALVAHIVDLGLRWRRPSR